MRVTWSALPWKRVALSALVLALSVWLLSVLAVVQSGRTDGAGEADAIVVLGAAQYVGRPSPVFRARLDHAVSLWKRGMAPLLVLTGGTGDGDTTSEAAVGRQYALKHGVPDESILLENQGRTTSESLHAVAAMMRTRGVERAILVSDPFHMLRLKITARRFGLTPLTSPTPSSPIAANPSESLRYVLSESIKAPLAFILERNDE
jgi:uncharacterized SAM-binding protein YcdF (DUF218 family)